MANIESTFGSYIADKRKEKGISQKELANKILKENGDPITPQYLNDIEKSRRNPSSDHLVKQFADVLDLEGDYLFYLIGKLPDDIGKGLAPKEAVKILAAFRKTPKKG